MDSLDSDLGHQHRLEPTWQCGAMLRAKLPPASRCYRSSSPGETVEETQEDAPQLIFYSFLSSMSRSQLVTAVKTKAALVFVHCVV